MNAPPGSSARLRLKVSDGPGSELIGLPPRFVVFLCELRSRGRRSRYPAQAIELAVAARLARGFDDGDASSEIPRERLGHRPPLPDHAVPVATLERRVTVFEGRLHVRQQAGLCGKARKLRWVRAEMQ